MKKNRSALAVMAVGVVLGTPVAEAQPVFTGSPLTDVSGAACRPSTSTQEANYVSREISYGVATLLTYPAGSNFMTYYCPLNRRNTSVYGVDATSRDRVRMTSLRARLYDGSSSQAAWCQAYVGTANGSTYWSSTRYVCSTSNGCTTVPASSYVGERELYWSSPFGTATYLNLGAANVGAECAIPTNSNIYSFRAVYSPNN
jgi:hypothetical protein